MEIKDHPNILGVTCVQRVETLAVVGFLYRDYRYKSVATPISHGLVGTEPMYYPEFLPIPGIEPGLHPALRV